MRNGSEGQLNAGYQDSGAHPKLVSQLPASIDPTSTEPVSKQHQSNNMNGQVPSAGSALPGKDNEVDVSDEYDFPPGFPGNGFLYNALMEKKSTYV